MVGLCGPRPDRARDRESHHPSTAVRPGPSARWHCGGFTGSSHAGARGCRGRTTGVHHTRGMVVSRGAALGPLLGRDSRAVRWQRGLHPVSLAGHPASEGPRLHRAAGSECRKPHDRLDAARQGRARQRRRPHRSALRLRGHTRRTGPGPGHRSQRARYDGSERVSDPRRTGLRRRTRVHDERAQQLFRREGLPGRGRICRCAQSPHLRGSRFSSIHRQIGPDGARHRERRSSSLLLSPGCPSRRLCPGLAVA